MNRIVIQRSEGPNAWVDTEWSEDFDGHPEDMPHRALRALAELDVGLGKRIAAYRAVCVAEPEWDMNDVIVTTDHADYDEVRAEEVEAERERAAESAAEFRRA